MFYDENAKENKVIIGKYPSNYELDIFIFIKTSLEFIKQENVENLQLVKLFFKTLNISDYKEEKIQLNNFILNHKISKETGMLDIYLYVNKFVIEEFEKKLVKDFKFYDDAEIINILLSLKNIPTINNIHKIIIKQKNEAIDKFTSNSNTVRVRILKKIDTTNLNQKVNNKKNKIKIKDKSNLNSNQNNKSKNKKKKALTHLKQKVNNKNRVLITDKSNLKANRSEWKGIKTYKKKKTFINNSL